MDNQEIIPIKDAVEKRIIDESDENSQEILPFKRRKSRRRNRIGDSDDENNATGNKASTDDADESNEARETDCSQAVHSQSSDREWVPGGESSENESVNIDNDNEDDDDVDSESDNIDDDEDGDDVNGSYTDEVDRIDNYESPDPRYLYEGMGRRKKTKTKRASTSLAENQDAQVVSIHKINLNHSKLFGRSVEDTIQFIVGQYNKEKESTRSEKKNIFREMNIQRKPSVKPEDEQYFTGDHFRVKVFVQKVAKSISLLSSYGVKEKAITIHSLIFQYRTDEIFAVTTNQSWPVVQWCSDFDFPGKIAARILSRDGELQSTTKVLVGTESTRKTTHKQRKKTNPYDLLSICTSFTAELRENASILRLSCFQKKNYVPVPLETNGEDNEDEAEERVTKPTSTIKGGTKVLVSLGNIRILKRFSVAEILSILSILSEISNGKATDNLNGEKEENSSAHKKYLTGAHIDVSKELNVCLSEIIHGAIADDNRMAELDNFEFCHKHSADFFSGYDFKLHYRGNLVRMFNQTPTIKQIVRELRHDLGQIAEGTSKKAFLRLLNDAKISYSFGTSHGVKKQEKLLNFIDGLLYHSRDNSTYWHVNAMWCHVQDGYIYLVHNQFKDILTRYLLTDKSDPAYLQICWSNNPYISLETKLASYLRKWSNFDTVWTSDTPEQDIVDMIKIGTDSDGRNVFFVYYFLTSLNSQTNVKCIRVAESIMQIGKVNMVRQTQSGKVDVAGSEDVRKQLDAVFQKAKLKREFAKICPNFDKFLKMITGAKYYLAIGREASATSSIDVASLAKEKEMTSEIAVGDIAEILGNLIECNRGDDVQMLKLTATTLNRPFDKINFSQLADCIHDQLRQHDFIEAEGNSIRGKLLNLSKKNFRITDNEKVNQFLYDKILSSFQPRACTVLSKLGFINMDKEISQLTITSFNLIEIPM